MASQTDKKEEFRKYLEKGGVLSILTKALTDLFEMDAKPDDPVLYLYHKFGQNVKTESTIDAAAAHPQDTHMMDIAAQKPNPSVPTAELPAQQQQQPPPQQPAPIMPTYDAAVSAPNVAPVVVQPAPTVGAAPPIRNAQPSVNQAQHLASAAPPPAAVNISAPNALPASSAAAPAQTAPAPASGAPPVAPNSTATVQ